MHQVQHRSGSSFHFQLVGSHLFLTIICIKTTVILSKEEKNISFKRNFHTTAHPSIKSAKIKIAIKNVRFIIGSCLATKKKVSETNLSVCGLRWSKIKLKFKNLQKISKRKIPPKSAITNNSNLNVI